MGAPTRRLVHLAVDTPDQLDCIGNEVIFNKVTGAVVGFTTSGGWGYLAKKSIAFGYINAEDLQAPLEVEVLGSRYDIHLQHGPFKVNVETPEEKFPLHE